MNAVTINLRNGKSVSSEGLPADVSAVTIADIGDHTVRYVKWKPGAAYPNHRNLHPTWVFLIAGDISGRDSKCSAKSLIEYPAGHIHRDYTSETGAEILLIRRKEEVFEYSGGDNGLFSNALDKPPDDVIRATTTQLSHESFQPTMSSRPGVSHVPLITVDGWFVEFVKWEAGTNYRRHRNLAPTHLLVTSGELTDGHFTFAANTAVSFPAGYFHQKYFSGTGVEFVLIWKGRESVMYPPKALIIDDNFHFATAVAERFSEESKPLFDEQLSQMTLPQTAEALSQKLKSEDDKTLILVNRECRLKDYQRQQNAGEVLFASQSWDRDQDFMLYSLRSLKSDSPDQVIQLPTDFANISIPDKRKSIDLKIEECLKFIEKSFGKIQHSYKEVSPTAVDVVRLIHGAVKQGVVKSKAQHRGLLTLLCSFADATKFRSDSGPDLAGLTLSFTDAVERLVNLYIKRGKLPKAGVRVIKRAKSNAGPAAGLRATAKQQIRRHHRVVVIDDERDAEGNSPWAKALNLIFDGQGTSFETISPSQAQNDPLVTGQADLIILDIDYQHDPLYGGDKAFGGLDLLNKIRRDVPRIPVVMMSQYDEIGLYQKCMDLGAFDYLTKSWSSYSKFRATNESEADWFSEWALKILVPLRYRPFFEDVELLRKREIVPRKEAQHFLDGLRRINNPNLDVIRALVTFFEQFVIGYMYCRGQTPYETLNDCLASAVFNADDQQGVSLRHILRIIRNNVAHYSSYVDEEFDTRLTLILLRAFYLRLISPEKLTEVSWIDDVGELASELLDFKLEADTAFFKNRNGKLSPENRELISQRNRLIDRLARGAAISRDECVFLAESFVRSLAVLCPRHLLDKAGIQLPFIRDAGTAVIINDVIKVQTRDGARLKRGYEIVSSISWVFDRFSDLISTQTVLPAMDLKLLRLMISRCWVWYFGKLLKEPNEVIFLNALEEIAVTRDSALQQPNRKLMEYFDKRQIVRFGSAYVMTIALATVREYLMKKRIEFKDELAALPAREEALQLEIAATRNESAGLAGRSGEQKQMLATFEKQYQDVGAFKRRTFEERLRARIEETGREIRRLELELNQKDRKIEGLEMLLQEIAERKPHLAEIQELLKDEESGTVTHIDQIELLRRRLGRRLHLLKKVTGKGIDVDGLITNLENVRTHAAAVLTLNKLRGILEFAPYSY